MPQQVVVVQDRAWIEASPLADLDQVRAALRARTSSRRRFATCGCIAAVAALLALLVAWAAFGWIVDRVVDLLPQSVVNEIGDVVIDLAHEDLELVDDAEALDQLRRLSAPLLEQHPGDVSLYIARSSDINAFATPGGHVTVHTGLIERAESPEQLLGVMAHELAHVSERHALQGMVGRVGLLAVVQTFVGDASALLALAADIGAGLTQLQFSRELEEEADALALRHLQRAEIAPWGLREFLEILGDAEREQGFALPGMLRTHPPTEERLRSLDAALAELEASDTRLRPLPTTELERLQERLTATAP